MPHPSAAEQPYAINVSGPSSGTRSVPLSVRAFFTASLKFMNTSTMTHLTRWDRAFIGNAPENRGRFGDGSGTAADAGRSLAAKSGRERLSGRVDVGLHTTSKPNRRAKMATGILYYDYDDNDDDDIDASRIAFTLFTITTHLHAPQ